MKKLNLFSACTMTAVALTSFPGQAAADEPKPLKVLLITGGCCHDYAKQKDILKKGIEARANVVVDIIYCRMAARTRRCRFTATPTTPRATTWSSTTNAPPTSMTPPWSRASSSPIATASPA